MKVTIHISGGVPTAIGKCKCCIFVDMECSKGYPQPQCLTYFDALLENTCMQQPLAFLTKQMKYKNST